MLNTQLNLQKLNKVSRANILSSGFTLIELLVVIVILAILAVAVIVAINPGQRVAAADNSKTKSDLSSIGSSAAVFSTDNGSFPAGFGGTVTLPTGGTSLAWGIGSAPYDGTGTVYGYYAALATGGAAGSCNGTTNLCQAISIVGRAAVDGTTYPGNANKVGTTGALGWCWRSESGQVTLVATADRAGCAP